MIANDDDRSYDGLMPPRESDRKVTKAFGRVLQIGRLRLGIDRVEVAHRAGVKAGTLGRIERGEREPSLSVFIDLAKALDMSPAELMEELVRELKAAPPSVAACYIVRDGQLLMVRRRFREGTLEWAGPSGSLGPGETAMQAAVRETMEEIGVEIEPLSILGDRVHPATGRHLIYVACRYLSGEPRVVDHEEVAAVEWVPIPEALERWSGLTGGVYPPVREYLERALAGERA